MRGIYKESWPKPPCTVVGLAPRSATADHLLPGAATNPFASLRGQGARGRRIGRASQGDSAHSRSRYLPYAGMCSLPRSLMMRFRAMNVRFWPKAVSTERQLSARIGLLNIRCKSPLQIGSELWMCGQMTKGSLEAAFQTLNLPQQAIR